MNVEPLGDLKDNFEKGPLSWGRYLQRVKASKTQNKKEIEVPPCEADCALR